MSRSYPPSADVYFGKVLRDAPKGTRLSRASVSESSVLVSEVAFTGRPERWPVCKARDTSRKRRRSGRASRGCRGWSTASSRRIEQEDRALVSSGGQVQGKGLLERGGEGRVSVFAAFALGDADPAGVQVGVLDADLHQLGDPHAGVEKGLDEDDVVGAASSGSSRNIPMYRTVTNWRANPSFMCGPRRRSTNARSGLSEVPDTTATAAVDLLAGRARGVAGVGLTATDRGCSVQDCVAGGGCR